MDGDSIGVGSRAQLTSGGPRCGGGGWIDCCSSKTSAPSVSHCLESVLHFAAVMNHSSFFANIPGIISLQHVLLEHPKLQEHSQTSRTRDFYLLWIALAFLSARNTRSSRPRTANRNVVRPSLLAQAPPSGTPACYPLSYQYIHIPSSAPHRSPAWSASHSTLVQRLVLTTGNAWGRKQKRS